MHLDEENGSGDSTGSEGERATEGVTSASEGRRSGGARRSNTSARRSSSGRNGRRKGNGGQRGGWDAGGQGDDRDARSRRGLVRRRDHGSAAGSNRRDARNNADDGGGGRSNWSRSASRAVGDGGSARGDGHILGGVDRLHRRGSGEAGEEGKSGDGETHFDGIEDYFLKEKIGC